MAFDFPSSPSDGQVSNGYTWSAAKGAWVLGGTSATGVVQIKRFTANGTYIPDPNLSYADIECWAGGGGGGGVSLGTATNTLLGSGGGAGSYSRSILSAAQIGASQPVVIGAGNVSQVAGGNTTFGGTLITTNGGGAGAPNAFSASATSGGAAGTGQFAVPGQNAIPSSGDTSAGVTIGIGGGGANSSVGGGGSPGLTNGNVQVGGNATGYAAGGGGASSNRATGSAIGGAGAPGLCIITEYCYAAVTGGTGGGAKVSTESSPPAGAVDGDLWWEDDTGNMFMYYNDGTSSQWIQISGTIAQPQSYKKNYIINGAMMVSQENGAAASAANLYYAVDQFQISFSNAAAIGTTQGAAVTPAGSPTRYTLYVTTADASVAAGDYCAIVTRIEGYRVADLQFGTAAAKTFTIRFGVRAPAGTYGVALTNNGARGYVAEYVISAGEANTDVVKSVTITGDVTGTWLKDNGVGLEIRWSLMCGTTYQLAAGAWGAINALGSPNQFNVLGSTSNGFQLFDVGLYEGTVAPTFVVPDFASELAACKRYFQMYGGENAYELVGMAQHTTTTQFQAYLYFNEMRIGPAIGYNGGFGVYSAGGGVVPVTGLGGTGLALTKKSMVMTGTTASGLTAGAASAMFTNNDITARFKLNARL